MNICLVNNIYPPIITGSSHYTNNIALNLAKRNNKVVVITNAVKGCKDLEIIDNVRIYRLPVIKLPKLKLWMKFPNFNFTLRAKNLKKIREIIIGEKIEVIHQCNNIFDLVFASAYYANKYKIPLICTLTTQIQHSSLFENKFLELFDKTIIKNCFAKYVHTFIAGDKEGERYINERYGIKNNIQIIPLPISHDNEKEANVYKKDYSKTYYNMVSVGHVSNLKNREELIKAWKIVVKEYPRATLTIVGDNFFNDTIKLTKSMKLERNIIFTGRIQPDEVYKFIDIADFGGVFLSSGIPFSKGVGLANLEIMKRGIPVVTDAYDYDFGKKFPFIAGEHFVKVESRDPQWLATKFIELFEDPVMRERIGKAGQKFITEVLILDKIVDEIEKVYKNAINKKYI